jgi:hypothetical protein
MLIPKMVVLLAALGLAPTEAPAPDEERKAQEEYRKAEEELKAVEQKHKQERVQARWELAERKEALRRAEEEAGLESQAAARIRALEEVLRVADPTTNATAAKAREELTRIRAEAAAREKLVPKVRRDILDAEEALPVLERQQEIQRRKVLARLEAAEARLHPGRPVPPRLGSEQKLHDLERKLDALTRELAELRRELRRQGKEP